MTSNPSIEAALLRAIEASRTPRTEPRESFYASSIGFCPRKQIAERLQLPPTSPPDARSQFKMWTGTILGQAIQTALETDGYCDPTWREKRLTYQNYVGRPDGYTTTIPAIVEVKTSDDDSITKYGDMPEHYLWQGMWYCLASGVPNLLIFQIGKNQGIVRNRLFHLDDEWRKKLTDHMHVMATFWDDYQRTKELPPHFHTWSWEDRYCPYLEPDTVQEALAGKRKA